MSTTKAPARLCAISGPLRPGIMPPAPNNAWVVREGARPAPEGVPRDAGERCGNRVAGPRPFPCPVLPLVLRECGSLWERTPAPGVPAVGARAAKEAEAEEPGVDDVARRTGVLVRLEWGRLGGWPAPKPPAPGPPDERRESSERIHW